MDLIWEKFTEWLKELLVGGIMDNLTGLFDNVNAKVAEAAGHIGSTPQAWNANIYSMIRSLSDNVILPIAGVILAFVMTLELIQLIADRNNLHDIDTWVFFRWVFKTAAAVLIVSNTWNIVMGVFEAAQAACAQYTESIRSLNKRTELICRQMEKDSRRQADSLLEETRRKCEQMEAEAMAKREEYLAGFLDGQAEEEA